MSEIWETFDDLFRAVNRQGRRVAELEARIALLEESLKERAETAQSDNVQQFPRQVAIDKAA